MERGWFADEIYPRKPKSMRRQKHGEVGSRETRLIVFWQHRNVHVCRIHVYNIL